MEVYGVQDEDPIHSVGPLVTNGRNELLTQCQSLQRALLPSHFTQFGVGMFLGDDCAAISSMS